MEMDEGFNNIDIRRATKSECYHRFVEDLKTGRIFGMVEEYGVDYKKSCLSLSVSVKKYRKTGLDVYTPTSLSKWLLESASKEDIECFKKAFGYYALYGVRNR